MSRAILLALFLTLPSVAAYHLSSGVSDQVGVGMVESAAQPSVPATSDLFRVGTGAQACSRFEPTGNGVNAGSVAADAGTLAAAHPFCKRLLYNHGTQLQTASPADQHYPLNGVGETWRFDAVMTSYVGTYGYQMNPLGGLTSSPAQILHNLFRGQGFWTEDFNTACEKEKPPFAQQCGTQRYAEVNLVVPHGALLVQDTARGAGVTVAQGNGWLAPAGDQTILGFLTLNGVAVGKQALQSLVAGRVAANLLPVDAVPSICGFESEQGVNTQSPMSDGWGWCEVEFEWVAEKATGESTDFQNPCTSPMYVCGTIGGGAWRAYEVCNVAPRPGFFFVLAGGGNSLMAGAGNDCNIDDFGATGNGYESTTDYDVWHFVVAPSLSACRGLAEPGFLTTASGSTRPYIAHDLDIYAPVGSSVTKTGLDDVDRFGDYYDEEIDRQVGVDVPPLIVGDPVIGSWILTTGDEAVAKTDPEASQPGDSTVGQPVIRKNNRLEPNAAGDTSGTLTAARTGAHDCAPVANTGLQRPGRTPMVETSFDPWVNYVDNRVFFDPTGNSPVGVPGSNLGLYFPAYDAYVNTAANQDASNRPAPGSFFLAGRVGQFADADDDFIRVDSADEYEQVPEFFAGTSPDPWETVTSVDAFWIDSIGAYPMFWDAWRAFSTAVPASAGPVDKHGCGAFWTPGVKLTTVMDAAGYDVTRTGLIQVLYTSVPIVTYPFPLLLNQASLVPPQVISPGTALVFLSQGLHESRHTASTAADKAFVAGLVAQALAKLPATPAQIVYPRDAIGFNTLDRWSSYQSDFRGLDLNNVATAGQCGASTGGFANRWEFTRVCEGRQAVCKQDTIVTGYAFRLDAAIGSLDVPASKLALPVGSDQVWWDVDPFDNNGARNT